MMRKLMIKQLELLAAEHADQFIASMMVSTKSIIDIAEYVRELEQKLAEQRAEVDKANALIDDLREERNFLQRLAGERGNKLEAAESKLDKVIPNGLHPSTGELVLSFAAALAEKLYRSEQKYGWADGWKEPDWKDKCLSDFQHHITKGDPRDVAAYCAFMWYHGWETRPAPAVKVIDDE